MNTSRFGLLSYPGIANLGDVIQSIAAQQYIPTVDVLIPRERISLPPGGQGKVRLIANGWFMEDPRWWPPHPDIQPLLISMHFAETDFHRFQRWRLRPLDRLLAGSGLDYLRAHGPVGARDRFTADELTKRGVPCYFSGCLTLTLERPRVLRGDTIVACDLSREALAHLRRSTDRPVVSVTHAGDERFDHVSQQAAARTLLETYAGAAAVVTTRIHAAQPCLAFGTPVLLLHGPKPCGRIADIAALSHVCTEADFRIGAYDFDFAVPPENPSAYQALIEPLAARCRAFVNQP